MTNGGDGALSRSNTVLIINHYIIGYQRRKPICSTSEARQYIETIADQADGKQKADTEKKQ